LLYYGKEYPAGYDYFRQKLKNAFLKNSHLEDPTQVKKKIQQGKFVIKELEALYTLKKYRHLKRNYYDTVDEENRVIETQSTQSSSQALLDKYKKNE